MNREETLGSGLDGRGMTCKEFVELVTDHLEGLLAFRERARFRLHWGRCPGCRVYLRQMKQTIFALGRPTPAPVQPAVREELLQRFRARVVRGPSAGPS
jgi:hypothetical protein